MRLQPLSCARGDSGHGSASAADSELRGRLRRGQWSPGPKGGGELARAGKNCRVCLPVCLRTSHKLVFPNVM